MFKDDCIEYSPIINSIINAKIIKTITREEQNFPFKRYIEYNIYLSSTVKNWLIRKRYKCFEKLNSDLQKKVKSLPKFPEKKLFNMNKSTIVKRKLLLEEYLNYILNKLCLTQYSNILDFIGMEKEEALLFTTQIQKINRTPFMHRKSKSFTILKEYYFNNI